MAGDLISDGVTIDAKKLRQLAEANKGKRGFTYTHHDIFNNPANKKAIRAANAAGFTVNLSGNNPSHADQLADENAGPVVTLLPVEYGRAKKKACRNIKSGFLNYRNKPQRADPLQCAPRLFWMKWIAPRAAYAKTKTAPPLSAFRCMDSGPKKADAIARK